MNQAERRVLSDATRAVRQNNKHLWWELKREIWDHGCQSYYPRQSEFEREATIAVARLAAKELDELTAIYASRHLTNPLPDKQVVIRYYAALMIEEIVRRARIAAYRTVEW